MDKSYKTTKKQKKTLIKFSPKQEHVCFVINTCIALCL